MAGAAGSLNVGGRRSQHYHRQLEINNSGLEQSSSSSSSGLIQSNSEKHFSSTLNRRLTNGGGIRIMHGGEEGKLQVAAVDTQPAATSPAAVGGSGGGEPSDSLVDRMMADSPFSGLVGATAATAASEPAATHKQLPLSKEQLRQLRKEDRASTLLAYRSDPLVQVKECS